MGDSRKSSTFVSDMTSHASHLNSTPGEVFEFLHKNTSIPFTTRSVAYKQRFWSYFVAHKQHINIQLSIHVAVVAVLQFQNRLYYSQKLTLYLYINIEVFLGYGKYLSTTATLQQVQQKLASSFRFQVKMLETWIFKLGTEIWKISLRIREPQRACHTFALWKNEDIVTTTRKHSNDHGAT